MTTEAIFTAEHKQFENKYLMIYFFKSLIHYAPGNLLFAPPFPWTLFSSMLPLNSPLFLTLPTSYSFSLTIFAFLLITYTELSPSKLCPKDLIFHIKAIYQKMFLNNTIIFLKGPLLHTYNTFSTLLLSSRYHH